MCNNCDRYLIPGEAAAVGKIVFYQDIAFRIVSMNGDVPVVRKVIYCDRCGEKITQGAIHANALRELFKKSCEKGEKTCHEKRST